MKFTCAYYRRKGNRELWALRVASTGQIMAAAGPLSDFNAYVPPMQHPAQAVSGWAMGDFELASDPWHLSRKNSIAPGLNAPGGNVVFKEDEKGFIMGLQNV